MATASANPPFKLGFIGVGKMGGSILTGLLRSLPAAAEKPSGLSAAVSERPVPFSFLYQGLKASDIIVCDRGSHGKQNPAVEAARALIGGVCETPGEVALQARAVVIGVKPYQIEDVLFAMAQAYFKTIATAEPGRKTYCRVIISMVAGWSVDRISRFLNSVPHAVVGFPSYQPKISVIMPSTPTMVNEGLIAVAGPCPDLNDAACELFAPLAQVHQIREGLLGPWSAAFGASPAYVAEFLQSLADAAVTLGIDRETARAAAAKALLGGARLALSQPETHPIALRDDVCSPGGLTMAGVNALSQHGFQSALVQAVIAADNKFTQMSKTHQ